MYGIATASQSKQRWLILGVVYLCNLSFSIVLQSLPPILTNIMADLNLSHTQAGLLMSLFSLPGLVISIPAGMIADRYGQKAMVIISLALVIVGTIIFASANSFSILALGRVVAGVGAVTLLILAPQILAQWFAGREIGIAMGVYTTSMPVGTILCLNVLSALGETLGWRISILLSTVLPVMALVALLLLFAPAPQKSQRPLPLSHGIFQDVRLVGASIWLVGAAWMFFNAATISMFTFSPDLLEAAGFSAISAGFYTSVLMWPALVLNPVVGYVIHRIDHKRAMVAIGGLAMTGLILWVPSATGWVLGLMLLIGLVQVLVPAPIYALSADVVSSERLGLGFGIFIACMNLGILFGPAIVGLVRDITGSYQASYALMSGFALMITLAIGVEKVKRLLARQYITK